MRPDVTVGIAAEALIRAQRKSGRQVGTKRQTRYNRINEAATGLDKVPIAGLAPRALRAIARHHQDISV